LITGRYQSFITPAPAWSLYREAVFGYSRFDIDTTEKSLHWQFLRTDESVADEFWICKNPTGKCTTSFSSSSRVDIVPTGSSWKFSKADEDPSKWHLPDFDDSLLMEANAPFVLQPNPAMKHNVGGYFFRKTFDLMAIEEPLVSLSISVAAENKTVVYVNGVMVDSGNAYPEQDFPYWNSQFFVDLKIINRLSANVITMYMEETGNKAFFDAEVFIVKEHCMPGSVWKADTAECV